MIRAVVAACLVAGLSAGCGGNDDEPAATTSTTRSMAVVDPATPDPLLVPGDTPEGLSVVTATVYEPADLDPTDDSGRFQLYGDPTLEDPSDGEQFVVGIYSDMGLSFDSSCDASSNTTAECGAWIVTEREVEECNGDCVAVVLGRNSTPESVTAVADSMTIDNWTPSVSADSFPVGIVELVDAPLGVHSMSSDGSQLIDYWGTDAQRLSVTATDGGEPMADLMRFFVDDDGSTVPFAGWAGEPSLGEVRMDGDTVIAALSTGIERDDLKAFLDSIHRDEGGEWEALRTTAGDRTAEELLPNEAGETFVAVVEGPTSAGKWVVGHQTVEDGSLYQEIVLSGPDPEDLSASGSGGYPVGPPSSIYRTGGLRMSGGGVSGALHTGFAPEGTASVIVIVAGKELDASVGEPSSLPGSPRPWGVFIEDQQLADEENVTIVSFDTNGEELGRSEPDGL